MELKGHIVKIEQDGGWFWRGEILEDSIDHVVILDQKTQKRIWIRKTTIRRCEVIL